MKKAEKQYIICTTARSGSNLLCDVLRNSRILGRPVEAFNPDFMRSAGYRTHISSENSVSVGHFVEWLLQTHSTPNGVFGTKLLFEDFAIFRHFEPFSELFLNAKLIHLRRRSKTKQAISYFLAEQTGQWIATDTPRKAASEVEFSYQTIKRHQDRLTMQDSIWSSTLNGLGMDYLEIYFEDFLSNMHDTVESIKNFIGEESKNFRITITLKEQSSEMNKILLDSFRRSAKINEFEISGPTSYKGLNFI